MEMIVVVFIVGLIAALAVPNLLSTVPRSRLNADTQKLATFLRQARLKAANTQKPIRVSFNCIDHFLLATRPPCVALMETAVFEDGIMTGWLTIRDGRLEFRPEINITATSTTWTSLPGSALNSNLIWIVFTPSSRLISSFGPPINISLWYGNAPFGGFTYDVTLNPASGRVAMASGEH
jgi:type II secretory pathway pseudopilin PulG